MRLFKWSVIGLLGALMVFAAVSAFFAWQLTSPPRRAIAGIPPELPSITETITFAARDGVKLSGWFVPREGSRKAVVLLHGHGSSRKQMIARARLFHDAGYSALLYDARAHGLSEGAFGSVGWLETADLLGALDFLKTKGATEIGCLGASQGGATIIFAATQLPAEVRWAVVESVYPTMRNAVDRRFRKEVHLPGPVAGALLVPLAEMRLGVSVDQITPITHIQNLRCPVFVLGGEADTLTLPASTEALFQAAPEPKELWLVPGAAHVDLLGHGKQDYVDRVFAFIRKAESAPRSTEPTPSPKP